MSRVFVVAGNPVCLSRHQGSGPAVTHAQGSAGGQTKFTLVEKIRTAHGIPDPASYFFTYLLVAGPAC